MKTASVNASTAGTLLIGGELSVNRLGFGTMRLTGKGIWGEPENRDEAKRVLRRAVDLGIDFIDTADSYGPDVAENLIAESLYPYPKELVIATKAGFTRQGPDLWAPVGRPEYLRQQVEMSLRRLRLERIDLFQLHRVDPLVPMEESLGALKDLQTAGKIRHIGLSEVTVAQIVQARRMVPIVSVQNRFNMLDWQYEAELRYCEERLLAFIPWFPLGAGKLARSGGPLDAIAQRYGISVSQLTIAWLLHRSPVMLPIPGTSSVNHLEENVATTGLQLDQSVWSALEQIPLAG